MEFEPFCILLESELFDKLRVVGVVVEGVHRTQFVETFDEHTFLVGVLDAHRTLYVVHAAFLTPLFYGIDECAAYFDVFDEVNPSEANVLYVPGFISLMVYDSYYASCNLSVFISQEELHVAEFASWVLLWIEDVPEVECQIGHSIRIPLIQFVVELYKAIEILLRFYFSYFDISHFAFLLHIKIDGLALCHLVSCGYGNGQWHTASVLNLSAVDTS